MTPKCRDFFFVLLILLLVPNFLSAQNNETSSNKDTLAVLWTSGDPDVAEKVCLMYTHAAKRNKWFNHVILIVWGPSAKLLSENIALQDKVKKMIDDGISVQACVVCADSYNVSENLRSIGIEVIGMGKPLTSYLKTGYSILNF
jgi:hypothetical protein